MPQNVFKSRKDSQIHGQPVGNDIPVVDLFFHILKSS